MTQFVFVLGVVAALSFARDGALLLTLIALLIALELSAARRAALPVHVPRRSLYRFRAPFALIVVTLALTKIVMA